jgi:hypothetical protein
LDGVRLHKFRGEKIAIVVDHLLLSHLPTHSFCSLSHPKNHNNVATQIQTNNSIRQHDVLERSDGLVACLVVTSSAGLYGRLFESSADPICVERHGVKQNSTEMSKTDL